MKIDEAIDILELLVRIGEFKKDIEATATLIMEYRILRVEVARLAMESIEREKVLARLEAEVMRIVEEE